MIVNLQVLPLWNGTDGSGENSGWQEHVPLEQRLAETVGQRHGGGHAVICCMFTPVSVVSPALAWPPLSLLLHWSCAWVAARHTASMTLA